MFLRARIFIPFRTRSWSSSSFCFSCRSIRLHFGSRVYLTPRVPAYIIFSAFMVSVCTGRLMLALTLPNQTYWAMTFSTIVIITFDPDLSFASASFSIASDAVPNGVQEVFINTVLNYAIAICLSFAGAVKVGVNNNGNDLLKGYRGAW
jgi:hypothetical protein